SCLATSTAASRWWYPSPTPICGLGSRTSWTSASRTTCWPGSSSPTAAGARSPRPSASTRTAASKSSRSSRRGEMLEREVKLGAGPAFHLPDLGGVVDGAAAQPPEVLRLETVYHDTPDLRLARWGGSLRHRAGEGW